MRLTPNLHFFSALVLTASLICKQQVCFNAFNLLYAVDKKRTFQLLKETKRNFTDPHTRAKASKVAYTASDYCRQWLERWIVFSGESMPMANGNAERPIIHLPAWMTKEWVYHLYIEECQEGKENGECLERTCVINGNEQLSFQNLLPVLVREN